MDTALASRSVMISGELYASAKSAADAETRSVSGQIEFWATLGRAALDNPDLPVEFVRDILLAKHASREHAEPFIPE